MSHQYPSPGQPGEQPPTQVAPQGGQTPGGPQYGGPGGYPQQGGPGGYPGGGGYPPQGGPGGYSGGGGYPGGPGGFPAPPTGGGGSKKGLIIGIIAAVVALLIAGAAVLAFVLLGDDDDDNKTAADDPTTAETTTDATESPTTESPTTEATTETTDAGQAPAESPTITSQAFLDSLLEGDCLAVEGLSTPEYFQREFKDQAGCEANAGNLEMSNAEYTFDEPVITGTSAIVRGDVFAPNTGKTLDSTWILKASGDDWLVDGFTYTEGG